jgi:hypothetical protein
MDKETERRIDFTCIIGHPKRVVRRQPLRQGLGTWDRKRPYSYFEPADVGSFLKAHLSPVPPSASTIELQQPLERLCLSLTVRAIAAGRLRQGFYHLPSNQFYYND